MTSLGEKARKIQGPVLVLGASGFIGAALLKTLLQHREDAYGTAFHLPAWRLEGLPPRNVLETDLLVDANLDDLLEKLKPRTLFNCVAYGAYSFEMEPDLIYATNFGFTQRLLRRLEGSNPACYLHAGSSSEYGDKASGPRESEPISPNSHYAVSKAASASLLHYYGKRKNLPCANLRIYSVYGPGEDSSRFIPALVMAGLKSQYPPLVDPLVSRDFIYIDDAVEAFLDGALNLKPSSYGDSFNIGSGKKTTIADAAQAAGRFFHLGSAPAFQTMSNRDWDVKEWYANIEKARDLWGWNPRVSFEEGLARTAEWMGSLPDLEKYRLSSKQFALDRTHSISAVVACYRDAQAIPVMYERLKATLEKLKVDYEIIFVNDNSPDDSEEVITRLSRGDRRVVGISHSRNFGSQAAFRSGMALSTKNACVLMDGDLQDPPELIEKFLEQWRAGFEVVYGRRTQREATLPMQIAYKLFYRVFDRFSYLSIPHDAGDFSLIDKRVVESILKFPERDFFLRGIRAYVGFKQTGVDYVRPERLFGVSTNNLSKNIGWAKKGILSFSYTPLNILSFSGVLLFIFTIFLSIFQISMRLFLGAEAPKGITTVLLAIFFFGSINLFSLAILGEYIAKIFEEVKQRPAFIRRAIIKNGEVRKSSAGPDLSR